MQQRLREDVSDVEEVCPIFPLPADLTSWKAISREVDTCFQIAEQMHTV